MDKTAEQFVSYTSNIDYSDLTPRAIHAVKRCIVDAVGCVYGTFNDEPVKVIRDLASQVTAAKPATVIGTQIKSSPEWAAFTNSAMIRYGDFSDDYFGLSGDNGPHPSDNIGGVLAAAESSGADGKTLILGIAIAYETCGQITDQCSMSARGWDYSIYHAISTSLGAGKILRLSREQLHNALALAIVPNVTLHQTRRGHLSNWKGFAGPNASRNGLFATLLAKGGITGPEEPFEGKAGFMKQLNNPFELGVFGGGSTPFKVEGTFFKYHPSNYSGQLPVWVALEMRNKVKVEDIESICVYLVGQYACTRADRPARWDPMTRETADHSLPYQIGAALIDGEITAKTFTPARFRDPTILQLVQKIRMEPDNDYTAAFPRTFNCRLEVTLKSGEVVTVHQTNPKGHPANPMSDQELEQKFLKQAAAWLPAKQSRALLDQLWKLDEQRDMNGLFELMRVPDPG